MTQPVDVDLSLTGDYTPGVQQATAATEGLATALNAIQAPSRSVQQALNAATPTRVHLAAWGGFTAAAAYWQSQTSGIRATANAAGQSMRVLEGDVRRLASSFPLGTSGAVELVQAVQGLGAQQGRIRPLATDFERLAAATNSFGPSMAQNFGQLNREMASLDPNRVARFGDVVTTLAAKTGASAMGLISFAHAIAPVAQQAGIGESAVLGISAAFVKLGDDGGAAATAVNKILSDLNRSVREGSNDMAAYAQITGMTVQQFKALYQANPAQALSSVTTAIGRAGPRGQMELENLGLEGVRTQRALLQLSQSGGLGATINTAIGSYGNNSTQRAAAAALGGLDSSLTELRSTAAQTTDALGGPFLHVLTRITDIAKVGLGPVNAALGSGVGQAGILGFGALAATGLVARRVVRPLGALALGAQVATSGPLRGLAGGYALGRTENDLAAAEQMRAGRFGRGAAEAYTQGDPYGRGFMQPLNRGFTQSGYILGQLRSDITGPFVPGQGGPGLSGMLGRGGRAGVAASSMAYEGWLRAFSDPFHQAQTPAGDRVSLLSPGQGGLFSRAGQARSEAGIKAALGLLEREGTGSAKALARMTSATAGAVKEVTTFAARVGGAGLAAGGSAVKGVLGAGLGLVGGVGGAALLGAGFLYSAYRNSQQTNAAEQNLVGSLDMYSVLNDYRDAMGQAGEAAVTLADQMQQASSTLAASVTTMERAQTVSAQDIAAGGPPDRSKARHLYRGSAGDIAGQVGALNLSGLTPQDVQGVKMDLLKQGIRPDEVNQILGMVGGNNNQGGVASASTLQGLVSGVAASSRAYSPSDFEKFKRHPTADLGIHGMSDFRLVGSGAVGSKPLVGEEGKKTLDLMQNAIMQQYADLSGHFSQAYVVQQQIRTTNTALQDALKTGDPDTIAAVAQRLGVSLTGNTKFHVSAQAVKDAGGDITKLVGKNKVYGQSMADLTREGVTTSGSGVAATRIASGDYTALQSAGASAFLPYFANARPGGSAGGAYDAISAFTAQPANARLQTEAVQGFVGSLREAGQSLGSIAVNANRAIGTTAGSTQALMAGAYGESQFQLQRSLIGAPRGQAFAQQADLFGQVANAPVEGPDAAKNQADARQHLLDLQNQEVSFYQQRVMAQYQYQIQAGRAQEDFQRQSSRSEEDFLIGRQRAYRDFNIQLQRQREDAAQQLYNPYQRIQVRPVFDSANLAGNRGEQIGAMRRQIADIKRLKDLGLSQAAIDQLQLYDPQNAMQADQLMADLSADRSQVAIANRQASTMQTLGGQLTSQTPEYRRQREDFNRSLRDQQADFSRQQSRARTDFGISMSRMAQDMHTQDLEITNDMGQLTKDMNTIISGQVLDLKDQVTSGLKDTLTQVNKYMPDITAGLNGSGSGFQNTSGGGMVAGPGYGTGDRKFTGTPGSFQGEQFSRAGKSAGVNAGFLETGASRPGTDMDTFGNKNPGWGMDVSVAPDNRRLAPNAKLGQQMATGYGWGGGPEWAALYQLWQRESGWSASAGNKNYYGIPQGPRDVLSKMGAKEQIGWGLNYISNRYGDPLGAWAHESRTGWYGAGGLFDGPQHIGVGEKGPEAVIPLNQQGMEFMVAALRQYAGSAKEINTGGMAYATHIVYTNDTYHYDSGQHIHGPVTVKANSPAEWASSAMETKRRDNLTSARGVRWRKS